ncbi:hypothetical protein M422DRAFT_184660 [Sphaerobolus stellatus SS14]|uniref:Unplaced genomic scaffold SPHSTscaffold_153, whole genome shotgun sequence n=1 Tax=Sphaerobolus stellatus (strain SS14) TaxID=990650 RepID=A0A0C9V4K5_SPHS4|nr:hypothetical protein M422DRAFT_184660 [Sphaerobolus stellatus SS14]
MGDHSYLNLPQGATFQGCPPPLDPSQPPQSLPPPYFPPSTLAPELQNTRCMSGRYKNDNIPRCVACIRRWAGDTCRFQGVRFLLRDTERRVQAITFVDHQAEDSLSLKFPTKWNVPLDIGTIRRLKLTVVKGLLPFLKNEQLHMRLSDIIRRPRETDVRVTCDTCMTSIFSCDWMCRACGRESCSECIQHVRDLTYPTRALTAKGEKKKHPNASFLTCVRRTEHSFKDFSPVSRFCMTDVDDAILEMEAFLADSSSRLVDDYVAEDERSWDGQEQTDNLMGFPPIMTTTETSSIRTSPEQPTPRVQDNPPATGSSQQSHSSTPRNPGSPIYLPNPSVAMPPPATGRYGDPFDPAQIPKAPFYLFQRYISDEQFRAIWATGQPLVVSDLLDNFSIRWTPQYFVDNFGHNKCLILDCHTDENKSVLVENFFSQFGRYTGRNKCWKLKDWPPSSDFSQTFPELFDDFSAAVPVPNYTRRDGSHNIASHFPANTIAPDLGPKMYNAFASSELPGYKGSTRLHMDMADAVNIMLHAENRPDCGEGVAAWDIYRAEDAPKIREFLRKHYPDDCVNDPIHSQNFYLDCGMRALLFQEFGVVGWRIYQKPGDAVFIPAGCAHQVVNLADCIKVACDFVSPENADRCFQLTQEFREMNEMRTWKEDVLQLSTMMWFCWLNLRKVEKSMSVA